MDCACDGWCTAKKNPDEFCPRCGDPLTPDRYRSWEVCWPCDIWMTINRVINEAEDRDLGPMAIVGLLIEARDRMFPVNRSV